MVWLSRRHHERTNLIARSVGRAVLRSKPAAAIVFFIFAASAVPVAAAAGSSAASCSGSSRRLDGGRRLGSGAPWYCEEYEKDHLEASSAAAMLLVAIAFETTYHHMVHIAEHSFVYGQSMLSEEEKHQHVARGEYRKPLRLILFARMGGEFMVLGFLAFTIWTCNQQLLFDNVSKINPSDIRTPSTGSDYLHLMEDVHMQLFVAMILYFVLAFKVVMGSDDLIENLETCRSVWVQQLYDGTGPEHDSSRLKSFKLWRGHFAKGCVPMILKWRETKPHVFEDIMKCLHIEKELSTLSIDELQESFTARFSFTTYVVFSLCSSVLEIVNVTHVTWVTIIIIKGCYAFLHRVGKVPLAHIAPVSSFLCFLFIVLMFCITRLFKKSLDHVEIQPVPYLSWLPGLILRLCDYCNPQEILLTTLQVLLFFLCHTWAGMMISKDFWNGVFKYGEADKIFEAIIYPSALCALAEVLPRCVPDFAVVMSLPPFFSHRNEKVLQVVAMQVVDSEMVKARAVVKKRAEEAKECDMDGRPDGEVKDLPDQDSSDSKQQKYQEGTSEAKKEPKDIESQPMLENYLDDSSPGGNTAHSAAAPKAKKKAIAAPRNKEAKKSSNHKKTKKAASPTDHKNWKEESSIEIQSNDTDLQRNAE